jgi:BioD-like phosphotransacetylase family protein
LGLVLTGGYRPRSTVLDAIRYADLFATLVSEDTYQVASEIHDLLVKTHPADREKIELIKGLVAEHLDIERILAVAQEAPAG